jgi:hypothetical protein
VAERCETIRERLWIDGPRGRLDAELAYPAGDVRGAALVAAPHPYMGGSMAHPLLVRIAGALAEEGFIALRFDYGGVGRSAGAPVDVAASLEEFWRSGAAPEDPRLVEEARAAAAWLEARAGSPALVGYSFGAFAAARIAGGGTPAMVLVAPTIARHDYVCAALPVIPALVVFGPGDFVTSEEELVAWARGLPGPTRLAFVAGGDHFFRGREDEVAATCRAFLAQVAPFARRMPVEAAP